ncbi:MAG TPA: fumarylacetoacetate hydrolase family protein [Bacteroidia bacterium]|nr:fumarylacetoacetate hydrolase family protein [Bacteroidia bacterium]
MKIICIGRNYAEHAKEMKAETPTEPVFFMKPDTALIKDNQPFYYPSFSKEVHHEVEVVLKVCKNGKNIQKQFANKYYDEVSVGIDFTARDLQAQCKAKGLPWEKAKAFDGSGVIGKFMPLAHYKDINNISFRLDINGKKVQEGNTKDVIFNFDAIIEYVSGFVTLRQGDLIYTGTPVGVGPVQIGDRLEAYLQDEKLLDFEVK